MMLTLRIAVIVVIQCLFLGKMIYERAQVLEHGTIITLKTNPIDPRSLFRGDYVILNYDISELDVSKMEGDDDFERWQEVYVAVENRGEIWAATGIYHQWPQIIGEQTIISGKVSSRGQDTVWIEYGIDSYFVPEGAGKHIEEAIGDGVNAGRVLVQIAVSESGKAAIKGLSLDGELLYGETLF